MARVTGIGGVFFKSADRASALAWYREHLGIDTQEFGAAFLWRELGAPKRRGYTVWGPFASDTEYFAPGSQPFMINFRVDDIDALVANLRAAGVQVVGEVEQHENGKFAWLIDPDGTKIELWEPVDPDSDPYLPEE